MEKEKKTKAIVLDIPFEKLRSGYQPLKDEERCVQVFDGVRCPRPRAYQGEYCDLHRAWDNTMLSTEGLPLPESPETLQVFLINLIKMLNMVYRNTSKTPQQLATIQTIVKLMAKNAHYL